VQVSIVVELAGVLPGDLTVAAVRDVVRHYQALCAVSNIFAPRLTPFQKVCAGHPFFSVVLHYTTG
jgi:hypothetical protein